MTSVQVDAVHFVVLGAVILRRRVLVELLEELVGIEVQPALLELQLLAGTLQRLRLQVVQGVLLEIQFHVDV